MVVMAGFQILEYQLVLQVHVTTCVSISLKLFYYHYTAGIYIISIELATLLAIEHSI